MKNSWRYIIAGLAAGAVNGLLGAGGGLILVPFLSCFTDLKEEELFPASLSVIFPICITSLLWSALEGTVDVALALPYLFGSGIGGVAAGLLGNRIPAKFLHRGLGILILWGGFRYLWS